MGCHGSKAGAVATPAATPGPLTRAATNTLLTDKPAAEKQAAFAEQDALNENDVSASAPAEAASAGKTEEAGEDAGKTAASDDSAAAPAEMGLAQQALDVLCVLPRADSCGSDQPGSAPEAPQICQEQQGPAPAASFSVPPRKEPCHIRSEKEMTPQKTEQETKEEDTRLLAAYDRLEAASPSKKLEPGTPEPISQIKVSRENTGNGAGACLSSDSWCLKCCSGPNGYDEASDAWATRERP